MTPSHTSIELVEAYDTYFHHKHDELSKQTIRTYKYKLKRFILWCEEQSIIETTDILPQTIYEYKHFLTNEMGSTATVRSYLSTVSSFLRFCSNMDTIDIEIVDLVNDILPNQSDTESRDVHIDADHCDSLLELLSTIEYGSRNHVIMRLLWVTGIRKGALRTIDIDNIDFDDQSIEIEHHPDTETPLKNGTKGERIISSDSKTMSILSMYIEHRREEVQDEYGREPLITTINGRISKETVAMTVAQQTRPCMTKDCPHGYDQSECDYWTTDQNAKQCPSSHSPHAIRRGAITHHLNEDIPLPIVSGKMDVSKDILKDHYDARTEQEKMKLRKEYTSSLFE